MVNCKEIYRYTRRLDAPRMDVRAKLLLSQFSRFIIRYDDFSLVPPYPSEFVEIDLLLDIDKEYFNARTYVHFHK